MKSEDFEMFPLEVLPSSSIRLNLWLTGKEMVCLTEKHWKNRKRIRAERKSGVFSPLKKQNLCHEKSKEHPTGKAKRPRTHLSSQLWFVFERKRLFPHDRLFFLYFLYFLCSTLELALKFTGSSMKCGIEWCLWRHESCTWWWWWWWVERKERITDSNCPSSTGERIGSR